MKFTHMIWLVIFPGSILTFLVIAGMIRDADLENFAFERKYCYRLSLGRRQRPDQFSRKGDVCCQSLARLQYAKPKW